ncbi:MAG: uroporphyrinogen decarboxylase [Leptospiraceae bacterium]|nr:uroporphyrinogen decarboxylase [Leptospiraceae bacterium]
MGPIEKTLKRLPISADDEKPLWFMRQAGRVLPRYLKLRESYSFDTLMKESELAAKVTLLPIEDLKVNGAILFSDILVIPEALGMELKFTDAGPRFSSPLSQAPNSIEHLSFDDSKLQHVYKTLEILTRELPQKVTMIGFCGAPLTVFCYMVQGLGSDHDFPAAVSLFYKEEKLRNILLEKITQASIEYAKHQVAAGARVFQLFDTWAGILPAKDFTEIILPYVQRILTSIRETGVPVIYFPRGLGLANSAITSEIADGLGVDWQSDLAEIDSIVPADITLQGNLDPRRVKAGWPFVQPALDQLIEFHIARRAKPGKHIFNLGHGVIPGTKMETLQKIVQRIQEK